MKEREGGEGGEKTRKNKEFLSYLCKKDKAPLLLTEWRSAGDEVACQALPPELTFPPRLLKVEKPSSPFLVVP